MKSSIIDARLGSKYVSDKYASGSLFPYAESVIWRCSVYRKGVLRDFTKFTGKHLCQKIFFNEVACLRPATLLKKSMAQVFSCEFCKISKNTFFYKTPLVAASAHTDHKVTNVFQNIDFQSMFNNFSPYQI